MILLIRKKRLIATLLLLATAVAAAAVLKMVAVRPASAEPEEEGVRVPIVMYHAIMNSNPGKYVLPPEQLKRDLAYIKKMGYETVHMADLIRYVEEGAALPEKPIVITFDDGYYNNYAYAYPLLKEQGMKAVISVIGRWTDYYTEHDDPNKNYANISWPLLREMAQSGVFEIQNHSYDLHTNKTRQGTKKKRGESDEEYRSVLEEDIVKMQELIAEHIGVPATTFTYPFGAVSNASLSILKDFGFTATLSCAEGVSTVTRDRDSLYLLKRCNRPYGKSSEDFFKKILE